MFFARASKSRTLAQKLIESGAVRINSERTRSPHRLVGPGDVLTMTLGRRLLVWRVVGAAKRRGPPAEAATLYEDMTPDLPPRSP